MENDFKGTLKMEIFIQPSSKENYTWLLGLLDNVKKQEVKCLHLTFVWDILQPLGNCDTVTILF